MECGMARPRERSAPSREAATQPDRATNGCGSDRGWTPLSVQRTAYKRDFGRVRFENAVSWFASCDPDLARVEASHLYDAGICAHLALTAYLLDRGFDDSWCAKNLAYRITDALDWANAAGLGFSNSALSRLAIVLTPYWQWGPMHQDRQTRRLPFEVEGLTIHDPLENLLHRIGCTTGYSTSATSLREQPWEGAI